MQRIRSLELCLSSSVEYLRELNLRYDDVLLHLQKGISQYNKLLVKIKSDVSGLMDVKEYMVKELTNVMDWKTSVSVELDAFVRENAVLGANVEKIQSNQEILHNKELALLTISCLAFLKLVCARILAFRKTSESDPRGCLGQAGVGFWYWQVTAWQPLYSKLYS